VRSLKTLGDVVDWGLCIGCGACAYTCSKRAIRMVHVEAEGYRPTFDLASCHDCTDCLPICPGAQVDGNLLCGSQKSTSTDHEFGPVLEVYEGWASDPDVRYRGSSGGVLSALSLYCIEQGGFAGVIHAGMDPVSPWMNRNFVSRSRDEVLARAGSRYAPSSPCSALDACRDAEQPYAFIGKPCDTAAVGRIGRRDGDVRANLGLVMTFFCAGTPSTLGTLRLMERLNTPLVSVKTLHYRGAGWPGEFRTVDNDAVVGSTMSYKDSWSALTSYRPLRCNLCPDGLGRVADISCGDAWHRYTNNGDPGRSMILVRTERGREALVAAAAAGYVTLHRAAPLDVLRAQPSLLERRRSLLGRLIALRVLGAPVPRYQGFSLLRGWASSGPVFAFKSVAGTLRRAIRNGWYRRRMWASAPLGNVQRRTQQE
jgi:coenzyme F420 hydrogenase subunit beta